MRNFWNKLNKPSRLGSRQAFYALAPMAGITDSAFRRVCKEFGADVTYSEMASATALNYNPEKTLELLEFSKLERPYVVQLFGSKPEHFIKATKIVTDKIKPDGIDINFGCPVPKIVKQGAGISLFKDLKRAREVIEHVVENTKLPVSIKTRSRVGDIDVLRFLDYMKNLDIKAIMIHGRRGSQGFSGSVDTEIIKKVRDYFDGAIIANGGVYNYKGAQKLLEETGADGIGIGQGAMGRPWIFKALRTGQTTERSSQAIYKIAMTHAKLTEKLKGEQGIIEMRKHLCWYVNGLPRARKMREKLVQVTNIKEIRDILK